MSDYIRREDALNIDFRCNVRMFESRLKTVERAVQAYAGAIAELPAADVVEVVRCKDCVNWDTDWIPNCGTGHYCQEIDFVTDGDFYCAHGKKRGGS